MAYKLIISADFPIIQDNEGVYSYSTKRYDLPIDYISGKSINSSSNIVSQPMMSGDTVSDHMYRLPTTYEVSGEFSLNGNSSWSNDTSYDEVPVLKNNKQSRLATIETIFEYIKNNGILCEISTFEENDKEHSDIRFINRKNMALKNITWNEHQNYIDFKFSFQEVIMVTQISTNINVQDKYLPDIVYPTDTTLGQIINRNEELSKIITEILYTRGYFEDEFIKMVVEGNTISLSQSDADFAWRVVLQSIIVSVAASIVAGIVIVGIVAGVAGVAAVAAAIFPVGTVIAGIVAVTAAIAVGVASTVKYCREQDARSKMFTLIDNSIDNGMQKLHDIITTVESKINEATSDLSVYTVQVQIDENGNESTNPVTTLITIGGNCYYLKFTFDKTETVWKCDVQDINEQPLITQSSQGIPSVSSLFDVDENNNLWFRDSTKEYQVYALNPSLSEEVNDDQEKLDNVKKRLNGMVICVFKGNPAETLNSIKTAVENVLLDIGYEDLN